MMLNYTSFKHSQVYPLKYCRLVEDERGLILLQELIDHEKPCETIKNLARMVLENCEAIKTTDMQLDG